jgi:hypothetical protein
VRCIILARALAIHRHLYRRNPLDHYSRFQGSILTYAVLLRESGREHEELYCLQEALDAKRDQYKRNPTEDPSNFLDSLAQHAERLSGARLFNDACALQKEIVIVSQEYFAPYPLEKKYFKLAGRRRTCITYLIAARRFEDAYTEGLEIVKMARALNESKPGEFDGELAHCLREYADRLASLNRLDEACEALGQAADVQRALYRNDPWEHMESLICFLNKYENALLCAGREEGVHVVQNEILDVYREAFHRDPLANWGRTTDALRAHATYLSKSGRESEVCDVEHELVGIYGELYEIDPDSHYSGFSQAVSYYGNWLAFANRIPDACDALLEIVDLHRKLYSRDPHQHHMRLAGFLEVYFYCLQDCNKLQDAGDIAMQFVTMYHDLWKGNHPTYFRILINAIAKYGPALTSAGCGVKGPHILVEVHRVVYEGDPRMKNAQDLAEHLASYARSLDETARWQDACDVALELAKLLRDHPSGPRSPENVRRTEQLYACGLHVVRALRFVEALEIFQLAAQCAKDVDNSRCPRGWVERWRPETTRTLENLTQINRIKKVTSQILEAEKLGLTYRDPSLVQNLNHFIWIVVILFLSIGLVAVALASPRMDNMARYHV